MNIILADRFWATEWLDFMMATLANDFNIQCTTTENLFVPHVHTNTTQPTKAHYTTFTCLLNAYENTQSTAEKRNIPRWICICTITNTAGNVLHIRVYWAGHAFRWVKKVSEEQKHHYPYACISTKYFANEAGKAVEILFNQGPL